MEDGGVFEGGGEAGEPGGGYEAAAGAEGGQEPPGWVAGLTESFGRQLAGLGERLEAREYGQAGYGGENAYGPYPQVETAGLEEDPPTLDSEDDGDPYALDSEGGDEDDGVPLGDGDLDALVRQLTVDQEREQMRARMDEIEGQWRDEQWSAFLGEFPVLEHSEHAAERLAERAHELAADLGVDADHPAFARTVHLSMLAEGRMAREQRNEGRRRAADENARGVQLEQGGAAPGDAAPENVMIQLWQERHHGRLAWPES
jgi:hypothetical protein